MPRRRDGSGMPARAAAGVGLVVAAAAVIVVAGFASEQALLAPWVVGGPGQKTSVGPLAVYGGGLVALAAIHWAAARLARRGPGRALAAWLAGVSAAGILFFVFVALLGLGFWSAAREAGPAETLGAGLLFFLALVGPSLASLVSAIVSVVARRPALAALPPLVLLATTGTSVVALGLG